MKTNILVVTTTYDRLAMLESSLETMYANPGMEFKLWVLDGGSLKSSLYGKQSGWNQLDFLMKYFKEGKIDKLILDANNYGVNVAWNQLLALGRIISVNPSIEQPNFIFLTTDAMLYEDNWLADTHKTLMDCESNPTGKVVIASPFHCKHSDGRVAHGMETIGHYTKDGRRYEIKHRVSGNTWFMRGNTWLNIMRWYPTNHPHRGGDWACLRTINKHGFKCAVTPRVMAYKNPLSIGSGKYNRLGHWK